MKNIKLVLLDTNDQTPFFIKGNNSLEFNYNPPLHGIKDLGWKYKHIYAIASVGLGNLGYHMVYPDTLWEIVYIKGETHGIPLADHYKDKNPYRLEGFLYVIGSSNEEINEYYGIPTIYYDHIITDVFVNAYNNNELCVFNGKFRSYIAYSNYNKVLCIMKPKPKSLETKELCKQAFVLGKQCELGMDINFEDWWNKYHG